MIQADDTFISDDEEEYWYVWFNRAQLIQYDFLSSKLY